MPVIPFSSASRAAGVADDITERVEAEEARRYREAADAKLKELMNTPVKRFDPNGGTPMIDIPEPVTGGWRVRTNGDPQVNADALPGGEFNLRGVPDIDDPMRDEQGFGGPDNWTPELAMPAAPEGESFVGMGSGGPERPVDPNVEAIIKRRADKQSANLRASLMQSTATPEQAAADLATAEKMGVSRIEVETNRKAFDIAKLSQEIEGLSDKAPLTYSWLNRSYDNLQVAHDDVESLGWWEQTAAFFSPGNVTPEKVGKSLEVGFGSQLQETLWGLDRMLGESNAAIYKALPDWVPGKFALANEQVQRSLTADMNATAWAKIKAEEMPQGVTWLERGIYGAAASAPSSVIAMATTVVTKNPYVGAGLMGATTAGGAYQEAREAGKSYWDSVRFALSQGGIETTTEFIPAKFLLKDLAEDAPFYKVLLRNAVTEGVGEQVATFGQDLDRWLTLNPEGTIAEFFAERPNAALETLVASTIMSGVTTTVAKGMQAAGDQLDQNAKQKRAEELAKFIDKAVDNGANSKLLKRGAVGADKYREAVAASTDAKFRIDSDAITALAQEEGVTVEQIAQAFRIDPDEMVTAIDTGSDVLVPVGNYVAAIQTAKKEIGLDGGAIHTALGPNMRANDGDLTAREMAAREETIAQELESRKQWGERENAFADAEDRLRDTIRQQISGLGIYNSETVDTYVEERAARVVTLATRMSEASGQPVDVEQFYKDEFAPIEFEGDWTQGTGALPQSMARKPVPIGDVELEFASKELSPQEFEAWKGARDGLSNEQIAERMNAVEPDAVVSSDDVKRWLFRSRERGYDSQKPHYNDRGADPRTLRLIELRARGVKNPQIAAALYPEVDTQTALNRVKALASKNKAKIEERRAALSAPESRGEFSAQTATIPRKTSLFAKQRLDTLLHEGAHEYLDLLWRLSRREDANPFVVSHLAAILNWHGLSPEWSNMYDAETGVITPEGRKLHETFAETYGVYFMTGKAPTTALRSVFETIKQWMLSVYKAAKLGLDQSIRNVGPETAARIEAHEKATGKRLKGQALIDFVMPAEIREVFDRSLAVDEAINAVTARLQIDGEQMAEATLKKLDPEGKWKPERRDKFMERMRNKYIQARDLAKANFQARMIDEHMRRRTAIYEAERREVEREVQSEVDERPEQRLFAWLAGKGWRKTRGDIANEAADEADAMRALAQAEELGFYEANATDASIQALQAKMVENGIIPIVLLFRTTSGRVIAFPGDSGNFGMHHDMAREVFGLGDLKMQHGVWNPRKWPTIEAMNAADTAWYDTTGTAADTMEPAPAQPRVMRGEAALAQGGEGLLVYRGSGDTELGAGRLGTGLYLAEDPEIGAEWGGEAGTVDAYRITGKLFDLTEETAQGLENYARQENTPAAERLFARLKAEGYVGIRDPWSGHINVFDAKDMVRTPENDAELGKTWTNYALEVEGDPSLAQSLYRGIPTKPPPIEWIRDTAMETLGPADMLAYINNKYPAAGPNSSPPYFVAASEIRRASGDRRAATQNLASYIQYQTRAKAAPDAIENAKRALRAIPHVHPMFFDDAVFNERMTSHITAGGESLRDALRKARADDGISAEIRADAAIRATGPRTLNQTVQPSRQLDAMGFYSAAQEAAQRVPDGIWQMGWQAARNSLAKGRDGVVPKKTEIEYLGLDAMFGDTKLKGAALKDAVLEHIAAKRLSLVENFARFDPNAKAPSKSVMLDEMDDDTLADLLGVDFHSTGVDEGRVVATELDGAGDFHTGLFVHLVKQEPSDDPVKRYDIPKRSYNLYRGLNLPGKRELIATGVQGDLVGKAARIIVNENRNRVMRKITAERMADVRRDALIESGGKLVRGPGDIRLPGEDVPLFEAVIGLPEGVPGSDYRAPISHVGGKAKGTLVTAHGEERIDDKGQRTVFVGQVQSDMAQQAREDKTNAEQFLKATVSETTDGFEIVGPRGQRFSEPYKLRETAQAQLEDMQAEWRRIIPDAPLLSTSEWTNVAVRSMLYRAAREGFQSISFPTAETSEIIQGNDSAAMHYETNVKGALEKLAKQLGGEVRSGAVKYDALSQKDWEYLQPEAAEKALTSLWARLPPGVRGALRRDLPKMRKTDDGEFYVATAYRAGADDSHVSESHFAYTMQREARNNPLIAAYQIWVQGAMIFGQPGAFERLITAAGGPTGTVAEALQQAIADGEPASAYILDITPAMRAKIMSEGFPLFQTGDDKGRATPPPNLPPMRLNLQAVKEQYGEQALAEIPPDVAAYSAEANDVEAYVQIARDVRKTLSETPPKSLWKFFSTPRNIGQGEGRISYRGIRDTDGELLKIIGEKKAARGLIADPTKDSKRSRSYDMQQAIEAAWEAGYFDGEDLPTPAQFLDTLRADIDGQAPRYRRDDIPTVSTIAGAERWKEWFEQNDMDITSDVATLRAKLATVLTGQGTSAIGPDEAAEVFNGVIGANAFPTGFDLLKALKQGPLRDKLIRDLTQQRMIERNGDVFRDGTIMAEAEAYARNEVQHRQFEIELEALAEAAGKGTAGALAKQTAIENLRSKQVREVLNYTQWLTLERRWAEKAIKAAAKGDTAQAAEFARYRLINSHQYVEGKKLAEKIEKAVKHAKSFDGKDKRIRLSKAGPDYIQQIDQILEGYEFKPVTRKKEAERTSLREWFAAKQATLDPMRDLSGLSEEELMAAQQEEIERSDALAAMQADANVQNYKSLTVEELMAVSDQLDMIERMARKEGALLVEGDRRLLNLALDDIEAQAIKAKPDELPPESYASYAPKEKNKRGFKEFFAELRTMQSIVRMIDGIDNGPLAKNTIQKLNQAGAEGVARLRVEEERVVALFRAAYGINVDDLRKDQVRIPGVAVPLAKMERLTVALYMGTEISRKRMRDGYGWDDATLQSIINTLDAKDWAFVSSVWDYANSLYPEANQAHQDVFGVPLSKQPGLPIVTKFGVIQGNYFPLKYNPHQSSRADQQAITDTAKQITGRAGTRKATSSTKERVKGKVTMPVLLDFSITLGMHVNEVVGNITTQKAILDAGRIIAHPRTQKVIVSRHGWVTYKALMSAMRDTRNGLAGPRGPTERIMVRVRNGATNVALGLNIGTVIKQMLGYTTSIVRLGDQRTGPIAGAGWLLRGMVRMGFSASGMQNGTAFILERSPYMRVRMQVMNQAIADQQRRINDGNIKADAKRAIDVASMFMMQRVQWLAVDGPTWLGAYEKFTASGMSEKDAAAGADQIVIDAQGSGEIFQVSAFQRGGPMQRIFTNYITAAIANWNLAVNTTRQTNFRNPGQAAIWAMNMGVLMVVPVIGSMAIGAMMSPGGGDEDEPLEEQYIREQVAFLIGPLGLFGQLGGAVGGFGYNGPQGTRAFEEASKVIMETFTAAERVLEGTATTKDAVDILRPANMAAGVWLGYPAAALDRFVRGAEALASGKTEDPKALLSGPPRE